MCEEFLSLLEGSWPSLYHVVWLKKLSGPVHTYPFSFKNSTFSLRIRLPSTRIRWKRSMKTELFENRLLSGTFWKRCFRVYVWTNESGTFRKPLRTKKRSNHFQSAPHSIRNLLKVAEGRFPFLSFIPGLISNLIACFQANLALLILQADYSRRRQNIIRLLSLPVSRGGRLDLPLVWLCFCPYFDILNCFCNFKERHNNINPHQRNSNMASVYSFAGS